MAFSFTKWQGCGNDFVVVDFLDKEPIDFAALAVKMCDRHFGIGADGLMVVCPSGTADVRMREFNPDGTEPEMCGNGIRCFSRWLYEEGYVTKDEFTVETLAGTMVPRIIKQDDVVTAVEVDMGVPVLEGEKIPVAGFGAERVIAQPLTVDGTEYKMTCVSMGNPHCVIFVDDAEGFPLAELGPKFENHPAFPRRINTEFVHVRDRKHARMRVWERGAGITLACGTGTLCDVLDRAAEIEVDGGVIHVAWHADGHIFMTGPAEPVFAGIWQGDV